MRSLPIGRSAALVFVFFGLCGGLRSESIADANEAVNAQRDRTLVAMQEEFDRNWKGLDLPDFKRPYYLSFGLSDNKKYDAYASYGGLVAVNDIQECVGKVEARVGDYEVDNSQVGDYSVVSFNAPFEDKPMALKAAFWQLADLAFKGGNQGYNYKKAYLLAHAEEKDRPADFSKEKSFSLVQNFHAWAPEREAICRELREASEVFKEYPQVHGAVLRVDGSLEHQYFIDSEGRKIALENPLWIVGMDAGSQAEDGTPLENNFYYYSASWQEQLQGQALKAEVRRTLQILTDLRKAHLQEPYSGPAILSGEAAGVMMHEVLGHRLECERQKDEREGQTFKEKLGKPILPKFLSLEDDPTLEAWGNTRLNGHYAVDDQGVPAQKAVLIQDGILKGFLMSRAPIKGFSHSNGHGRSDASHRACGRMGNLILRSRLQFSDAELKQKLMEECRRRGKVYGLYFKRIAGGDTLTQLGDSQAFRGLPLEVYRVDAKSGEETLVRGVEIVGTPLNALNKIIATGRECSVFNGICGAGSGWVPVSSVAPALLVSEIEVQGKKDERARQRILPAPWQTNTSSGLQGLSAESKENYGKKQ